MMDMKEKLEACYERMQTLNMPNTRHNMETLLQTLYDLQEVYKGLERTETDGTEADPGERDED
jgi:hypothetical protein